MTPDDSSAIPPVTRSARPPQLPLPQPPRFHARTASQEATPTLATFAFAGPQDSSQTSHGGDAEPSYLEPLQPRDDDGDLPTYEQLLQTTERSNPRFGRWQGWIEKRARERKEDDRQDGAAGRERTGWDLPGVDPSSSSIGRTDEARAQNPDAEYFTTNENIHARGVRSIPSSPVSPRSGRRRQPLTSNTAIHSLDSRFARGLPEPPRCAAVLRSTTAGKKAGPDRFILIGTAEGLYVADLFPMPSSSAPHVSDPTQPSSGEAIVLSLWSGLGVLQIDVIDGIVFALVVPHQPRDPFESELRMWNAEAIENLVKWRAMSESSVSLPLDELKAQGSRASPDKKGKGKSRAGTLAMETGGPATDAFFNKRASRGFLKSIFDAVASPSGHPANDIRRHRRQDSRDSVASTPRASIDSTSSSLAGLSISSDSSRLDANLALPLEWANACVPLPLPRSHTLAHGGHGVLFYRLYRRSKGLVLVVATPRAVLLYESPKATTRSRAWTLKKELYAPSQPSTLALVRTSTSTQTRFDAQKPSLELLPSNTNLLLGMSAKAVLIHLSDLSVRELAPPAISNATSSSHHARSRSKSSVSASSSIRSTSSSSTAAFAGAAKKVALLVTEGKSSVPAGMSGADLRQNLSVGRRLDHEADGVPSRRRRVSDADSIWVGFEPVIIPTQARREEQHLWLVTRGKTTQVWRSPLDFHESDSTVAVRPLHVFEWTTSSPIKRVLPLIRSSTLTTEARSPGDWVHLILVAFSETGVAVQEFVVDLTRLEEHEDTARCPSAFRPCSSFPPGQCPVEAPAAGGVDDLEHAANLDFGRRVQLLCAGGPRTDDRSVDSDSDDDDDNADEQHDHAEQEQMTSGLFFAVEGRSDWSLHWLG